MVSGWKGLDLVLRCDVICGSLSALHLQCLCVYLRPLLFVNVACLYMLQNRAGGADHKWDLSVLRTIFIKTKFLLSLD